MNHPRFSGGLATRQAINAQMPSLPRRNNGNQPTYLELELRLAALQKEHADLQTAITEAAQVYRRLCAPRLVRRGNFEIASETFAVRHVPGDFFAIEETGGGIVLALGDISGKGLAAGMWTTYLVGLVGTHASTNPEPRAIVARVNEDLCRMRSVAPLTSLFLAKLDPASGRLDYSNAGHPPALLLRANGELELLSEGGVLPGVVPAASFVEGSVHLNAGDVLLVCSDGILESLNDADQEFGYMRLEAQLRRAQVGAADAVLFSVLGAVQDFAAARPLVDDMSLVIVRRDSR